LERGFTVGGRIDSEFMSWVRESLESIREVGRDQLRIAIDISSMSRLRLAIMVDSLRRWEGLETLAVDFLYSIAAWGCGARDDRIPAGILAVSPQIFIL
jgi:hypothetical protein